MVIEYNRYKTGGKSMEEVENRYKSKIITIPNVLSFFRLCLIPVFVWMYCARKNYPGTVALLLLSGLTDLADGFVARKFHMISDLGKALDPIADKLTQGTMLLCLLTRFPAMIALFLVMLVKEGIVGVTNLLLIRKTGKVMGACWHGKIVTCLFDAVILLHVLWYEISVFASNLSIAVCIVMAIVSFLMYVVHNVKTLRS